ncbi:MAG: sulfatase-like hydrolase/transferase, partial [Planctomycetota bacterium]
MEHWRTMRAIDLILLFTAAAAAAACGSGRETLEDVAAGRAEVSGEGVLVIAIDGLRWDHTSLSGYDRDTTPFLASLGREGMIFSDAWSPSPSLVGAHVGILSGSDPLLAQPPTDTLISDEPPTTAAGRSVSARSQEIPWFIPEDLWLLGQSFLSHGWNTA